MSGNRYDYDAWADCLFEKSQDPSENHDRDMIIERFGSIDAFSAAAHAAVTAICEHLDIDPPGVLGMHRATYLSVCDYMGHGTGLWEIEGDEPWAAKLRPALVLDERFGTVLAGLEG